MSDVSELKEIFDTQNDIAKELLHHGEDAIQKAYDTFTDKDMFKYEPYEWQVPNAPIVGNLIFPPDPGKPGPPMIIPAPGLLDLGEISNMDVQKPGALGTKAPIPQWPAKPGTAPTDPTGQPGQTYHPVFGNAPALLPLPSMTLPYPSITVPPAPDIIFPVFDGVPPDDIHQITFDEYMAKLREAYAQYSQDIPALVYSNWMLWFKSYLGERPLIDKLAAIISNYLDTGGAGIPIPIEEAIVTRGTDRVAAEQRRATLNVYNAAVKRGLLLPSGAMLSGLKEARQASAEAVSKVVTDVAIKNLELEHDFMKFMIQMGIELEKWVASFAGDVAKIVLEANAQAIEMTKFVLTGMIEINNIMVKIYLAQWEAYKGAVEVFKAKIAAVEAQIRVYEAEIKAELAKVEINKAWVELLTVMVNANNAIVSMYKTQVETESIKVEASRLEVMVFEAKVRAYSARVEAWRAEWMGYTAGVEGEVAKFKGYEAEVNAYTALINAYRAEVEGYSAKVRAEAERIRAVGQTNEENLKSWSTQAELYLKEYVANTEAYKAQWAAIGERMRAAAEGQRIVADSAFKGYETESRIDTERAREHLSEWTAALQAHLNAANGLVQAAGVSKELTAAALNSLTAFSGTMAQLTPTSAS